MSDLISRSELLEIIKGTEKLLDFQKDECIACINSCDIAYDIGKVVEELYKSKAIGADCVGKGFECVPLFKAIEIVKQCGVSDDACEWKLTDTRKLMPYKTSCGNEDLYDNSYKYCPYCGKKILCKE